MSRKLVLTMFFMTVLIGTLGLSFEVQRAKANGTVLILADGSVDPPTAPIQRVGDLYTFIGNIFASGSELDGIMIAVYKSNIIVDGNGYLVQGVEDSGTGFFFEDLGNVTIENTNIKGFSNGIYFRRSSNITVSGNNITANTNYGIWPESSSNLNIVGNNIAKNAGGIWLTASSCNNNITENNVTSHSGYGILLGEGCSNNSVVGNNMAENDMGIVLSSSHNEIVGNSIAANVEDGIFLAMSSEYNSIVGNDITANKRYGIMLRSWCSNNVIYHNNFLGNIANVYFEPVSDPNVWDNGYPSGGNYWSDYNGTDSNLDGIGDTAYAIDENNTDTYPLMRPYVQVLGDVNDDRLVDIYDAILLGACFNSTPDDPDWNSNADFNSDGLVDIFDAIILASNFGKTS